MKEIGKSTWKPLEGLQISDHVVVDVRTPDLPLRSGLVSTTVCVHGRAFLHSMFLLGSSCAAGQETEVCSSNSALLRMWSLMPLHHFTEPAYSELGDEIPHLCV